MTGSILESSFEISSIDRGKQIFLKTALSDSLGELVSSFVFVAVVSLAHSEMENV